MRRRGFLAMAAAMIFSTGFGLEAQARSASPEAARAMIERITSDVLALVKAPGSVESKRGAFRALMENNSDMRQIAGFAVGVYARSMNPAQRNRYVEVFAEYLSSQYVRRFDEYQGETISIGRVADAGARGYVVESMVNRENQSPIEVQWLVSDRSGALKVADIVIEGVSMAQSYRSEFTGMIAERGDNIDAFINALESRT